MLGIILAGGEGKRFSGTGFCKPLLRVNGKYLIEYALENLAAMQVEEALVVVGRFENELREAIGPRYGAVAVRYVRQPEPKGLINAFLCAARFCGSETVVLQLSDEIFISPDFSVLRRMDEADFICGYTLPEDPAQICENYAVLCSGETLLYTVEKPGVPIGGKKGTGFCVFSGECVSALREAPGAEASGMDLCGFMNMLVRGGKKGLALRIAEEEINVNHAQNYAYARRRLEAGAANE